ncbi:hypothetical protein RSAG8_00969, partial [Rhizoctonia solani AG-8 WAC10335]
MAADIETCTNPSFGSERSAGSTSIATACASSGHDVCHVGQLDVRASLYRVDRSHTFRPAVLASQNMKSILSRLLMELLVCGSETAQEICGARPM